MPSARTASKPKADRYQRGVLQTRCTRVPTPSTRASIQVSATPGAQMIRLESGTMLDPTGALKNPPPRTPGMAK